MEKSSIHRLYSSIKRYLGLQKDYVMLSITEKLTVIMAALVLLIVMFAVLFAASLFLMLGLSVWLGSLLDCEALGYVIAGGVYALVALIVYLNRINWIVNPIARFIAGELLKDSDDDEDEVSLDLDDVNNEDVES